MAVSLARAGVAANAPAVENSDEYEPEEFEPREAVIVSGYLEKYDLVKHI